MRRRVDNQEIARLLQEMAVFYEMDDVPFKPQAYEKAAASLLETDQEASELFAHEGIRGLRRLPGVGEGIAHYISLILQKGTFPEYEKYRRRVPVQINELLKVEGLGPKTIKALYEKLKIKNLADLEKAARAGKIQGLPHFGARSQEKILKNIEFLKKASGRFLLGELDATVKKMEERLKKIPGVEQVETAGSFRRRQETVGDIDILVTAKKPEAVIKTFIAMPEIAETLASGPTKAMVRLKSGIHADVRVVPKESYGAALQYFTGSKEHNIALRKIAINQNLKLNEYGLFSAKGGSPVGGRGGRKLASRTEEEIYQKLGLIWMPPELRTDTGEIQAACQTFLQQKKKLSGQAHNKTGGLPKLIPYDSILGDLQIQTNWTDGQNSLEEMVAAARQVGLEYIAITDHTKSLAMTGGLNERKLAQQGRAIDRANSQLQIANSRFKILKSAEVNILKDGKLDINNETLKKLDLVSVAVHSHFNLPEKEQTERVIKALKHPLVNILFHPTGRLINRRAGLNLNMEKIFKAAKEYGVALEINAFPDRLDLKDTHIRQAMELGVKLVIDSDAHSIHHFNFYNFGLGQARRGWATKKDILNTLPCDEFLKTIKGLKK